MFIGSIICILIIIGYAMHVGKKYALKSDVEELERRVSKLEETSVPKSDEPEKT